MADPIRAALERLVTAYDTNEGLPIEEWLQMARTALAAEPPAPDPDPSDFQAFQGLALNMVESLRPIVIPEILGVLRKAIKSTGQPAPAADGEREDLAADLDECAASCVLAEKHNWAKHMRRAAALLREPAPAPDHFRTTTEMVADGEREELAVELQQVADALNDEGLTGSARPVRRAAALLRQPAPAPVPVSERPWEREGWCDAEGRCWWFAPTEAMPGGFRSAGWGLYRPAPADEDTHCLPHWAIPQPPQGEEVAE